MTRKGLFILLLLGSCGTVPGDRDLYIRALDENTSDQQALDACQSISHQKEAGECLASVVRQRESLAGDACRLIQDPSWRQECHFLVAERLAASGRRWDALVSCGRAGRFLDECLYHVWTRELQELVKLDWNRQTDEDTDDRNAEWARLPGLVRQASQVVDYFGQVETTGPNQEERVWGDFWYFYWLHHRPPDLRACTWLVPRNRVRCQRDTALFVQRLVTDRLVAVSRDGDLLDRSCRAGQLPPSLLENLATDEPLLVEAAETARERICTKGTDFIRPWNPMFQPRMKR